VNIPTVASAGLPRAPRVPRIRRPPRKLNSCFILESSE
jgi:hypothetical protein